LWEEERRQERLSPQVSSQALRVFSSVLNYCQWALRKMAVQYYCMAIILCWFKLPSCYSVPKPDFGYFQPVVGVPFFFPLPFSTDVVRIKRRQKKSAKGWPLPFQGFDRTVSPGLLKVLQRGGIPRSEKISIVILTSQVLHRIFRYYYGAWWCMTACYTGVQDILGVVRPLRNHPTWDPKLYV
jgi:hypothetical protein